MKKQLPVILLAIACVALIFAYNTANDTIRQLRQELALSNGNFDPDDATFDSAVSKDVPIEASTAEPLDQVSTQVEDRIVAETDKPARRMMENMAKMMENPTMNKVMEAQHRGTVIALYSDLVEYLNLNKEETEYFMDLLVNRQMKQTDLAMKMMGGQLSDDEQQALQGEMKEALDAVKKEMENFLNSDEDYAEFEFYEKTMSERMMLSQMDKNLSGSDTELSDATYRQLLDIMHNERESFEFSSDLNDQENTDLSPERFSRKNLENFANDTRALNDVICRKAQAILTPEQYEAFVGSLKTFTDMQLAQMEMAAQMFGGE